MKFFRFRTRSASRDKAADNARILSIRESIQSAIAGAESELVGLTRRIDDASVAATYAFDRADPDVATRTSAEEAAIRGPELAYMRGLDRKAALEKHISALRDLEAAFDMKFSANE